MKSRENSLFDKFMIIQEPKTKKIKKNTNIEEEQTTTGTKKTKKTVRNHSITKLKYEFL